MRDDRTSVGYHRRRDQVLVVEVRKAVRTFQSLPALDLRVVEAPPHLLNEVRGSPGRLALFLTPPDPLRPLLVLQLVEDYTAPHRPIHPLDRKREQEVALKTGPQDTSVEEGCEHASFWQAPATAPDRATRVPELLQHRIKVLFVLNADGGGLKCGVLLGAALLSVRKQIW